MLEKPFDYKPLKVIKSRKIKLPPHPISRNPLRNRPLNTFFSILERTVLGVNRKFDIYETEFESPIQTELTQNNIGRVRHYKASSHSAVLVLPQRGSGYNAAQLIASYLATNGISAYEIEPPLHGARLPIGVRSICDLPMDLDKLKTIFRQAILETRGLINLVEEENIGIFGVSLGAIYASIVYGIDKRITSACLLMAGGNLTDMIFESNDRFAKHLRKYIVANKISREQLKEELAEIEPLNYTRPSKAENLVMITATSDKDVGEQYGRELREAWSNPRQYLIDAGHLSICMHALKILPKILKHFQETLGYQAAQPTPPQ